MSQESSARPARTVPLRGGTRDEDVLALLTALRERLDGTGPAVRPVAPDQTGPPVEEPVVPESTAVLLATSGSSSGSGRLVVLDTAAMVASARATHERLGGPGQWLACLPVHHVAGLQVLLRSVVAGTAPVVLDGAGGFRPEALVAAVRRMRGDVPRYVSLVPTQLSRVLASGGDVLAAVRSFDAVLVGGAGTPPPLLARAHDAGVRAVTTYGMTETAGGCVYDGLPLRGVVVEVDDEERVWLGGPTLARGYLDDAATAEAFVTHGGRRMLRTNDRGALADGVLTVHGRLDDVILSGGLTIDAAAVERVLHEDPRVVEAVVVGVPDDEWGALVTAVVTGSAPPLGELRALVGQHLGRASAPRAVVSVPRLPLRGPGKVDRRAAAEEARRLLAAGAPGSTSLP